MVLAVGGGLQAAPVITEFMAANRSTLADGDGEYSDWIEIHNPDAVAVELKGWSLTDSASSPTKWQFPDVTLPPGGYVVVFASNKNRRVPGAELHTNFALSAGGEFLGLFRPDGVVASEYAPAFPAQTDDVSFGLPTLASGGFGAATYLSSATPGRTNPLAAAPAPTEKVVFSRAAGPFSAGFLLELKGAGVGQVIRYVLSTPATESEVPAEVTADSPEYTAALRIDGSTLVRAAIYVATGAGRGPVTSALYTKVTPEVGGFSSQLPVLVIDSLGSGPLEKDGIDHPTWMYVFGRRPDGQSALSATPELVTPLTSTVRGSSSAEFPKKGFNLKLTDETGAKRVLPLLGMPAHEKWALVAHWKYDPGFVNNSLIYGLSNAMGRWAARTRLVELFFNADGGDLGAEDYAGIYTLTDRIEVGPSRVAVAALSRGDSAEPAVTGGYILKIDNPDPDEFGWTTARGVPADEYSAVILVAPKADDVSPAQRDYIVSYVQRMEDALHADAATGFAQRTYLDYIDRASWVDHHLLNTFTSNPDSFERSAYFTKPRDGKLQAGPVWDFDRALGSYADERSYLWDVWSGYGGVQVWESGWWAILAKDPEFRQDWVDRWQSLRQTLFSHGSLVTRVEALTSEIGMEAAERDAARWEDNASPHDGYAGQVEHLKAWVTQRARWIDDQFVAPPFAVPDGEVIHFTPSAGAVLVYTLDGSDPRSLGGAIAPNAVVSAVPVALPADTNVHARSYREDMLEAFPGTPWSSAVGGKFSTPLTPASRIVNLSIRARVGTGAEAVVGGVTLADTAGKSYLARAIGPSLASFGAADYIREPRLVLRTASGDELARNEGWLDSPDAARLPGLSRSVGAFALVDSGRDAALVSRLGAGSYLVEVTSASGEPGTGMMELYELDGLGRAVNLSVRAYVRPAEGSLVGGFVIHGPAHKRLLVRAVGPTLARLGLGNVLEDPLLTIYSGTKVIATSDQWEAAPALDAIRTATTRVGAFQLGDGSSDAAMLVTLAPGAYTVEVRCKDASEGVALLEIYDLP